LSSTLSVDEIKAAEVEIIKCAQSSVFHSELATLGKEGSGRAPKRHICSAFRKLNPVLFEGVLRVGGRLSKEPIEFAVKHPIILPTSHHVTRLIVEEHRKVVGHSAMSHTWSSLRQRYWILKGAATVGKILESCILCKRRNSLFGHHVMSELPTERVSDGHPPFCSAVVDYFGPLFVKQGRLQPTSNDMAVCLRVLTVRAVHIEIAHSLTTDSFIDALRRFIGRRGKPEAIFSEQ